MRSHSLRETPGFWFWFELTKRSIETHLKESAEERNERDCRHCPEVLAATRVLRIALWRAALPQRISQSGTNAASVGHRVENIAAFVNNASHSPQRKTRKILVHVPFRGNTLNN
jgi:hypothetical protein